jgi:lactoylglutathione lyase
MSILGLDHAGLTVANLDRSLAFYEGLLGLPVAAISLVESPEIDAVVGHPGARLRIADLALPSGGVLELIVYEVPDDPPAAARHTQAGTAHIALQVSGLAELHARLVAARADLISIGPVPITDGGAFEGVVVLYLRDPDGNVIELIERPAPT